MSITSSSYAAGVGVRTSNVGFAPAAQVVPRKILIFATGDPDKEAGLTLNEPMQVLSPEDAADKTGFGFMAHRLAAQAFRGGGGVPVYLSIQAESAGAAQATGSIQTAATAASAGTLHLYIAGDAVPVTVSTDDDGDDIATAIVAAVDDDDNLPVTAEVDGTDADKVNFTAKSAGPWGNEISIALNLGFGESTPAGITTTITDMADGAGTPAIQTALDNLGTGDDVNEDFYTDVTHGYLLDTTTLDAIADYVGRGDIPQGTWSKLAHRPFRVLTGDVEPGTSGFTDLRTLADARRDDRGNGVIAVPGSRSHPSEIAAQAIGHMARVANFTPAEGYVGIALSGIDPGQKGDRWTSDYTVRDQAARGGVGITIVRSGAVIMQNQVTFYRPANIPEDSNGYRSMRSIAILQNIVTNVSTNFQGPRWDGFYVVGDTARVSNPAAKEKARDRGAVLNDLVALAEQFAGFGWLFTDEFTVDRLASDPSTVTLRTNGTGFDVLFPLILSGEGGILDINVQFDTALTVVL